jgi:hypothetical protein
MSHAYLDWQKISKEYFRKVIVLYFYPFLRKFVIGSKKFENGRCYHSLEAIPLFFGDDPVKSQLYFSEFSGFRGSTSNPGPTSAHAQTDPRHLCSAPPRGHDHQGHQHKI